MLSLPCMAAMWRSVHAIQECALSCSARAVGGMQLNSKAVLRALPEPHPGLRLQRRRWRALFAFRCHTHEIVEMHTWLFGILTVMSFYSYVDGLGHFGLLFAAVVHGALIEDGGPRAWPCSWPRWAWWPRSLRTAARCKFSLPAQHAV